MSHRDFSSIAVGDTIMIYTTKGRALYKVTKVTKTQFSIDGGRFMRSTGRECGGHYRQALIPDAKDIEAAKADQRQELAVWNSMNLQNQIAISLSMITMRDAEGWAASIEASNEHMRRALEALQLKQ